MDLSAPRITRDQALAHATNAIRSLYADCRDVRLRSNAGDFPIATLARPFLSRLTNTQAALADAKSHDRLIDHAAAEFGEPADVITARFMALEDLLDRAVRWVELAVPRDAETGAVAFEDLSLDGTGAWSSRTLSPAQTATLRTILEEIEALITGL